MTEPEVLYDVSASGVATITLNRPERLNALTANMIDHLLPAMYSRADADPAVRVVVLTGSGRGFCSGADVRDRVGSFSSAGTHPEPRTYLGLGQLARELYDIRKPVIAALNGPAAGGGLALALAADFRLAGPEATFTTVMARRGMVPDCGMTFTLPRAVGSYWATRLMMTAETIDAATAHRIGLVDEVAGEEGLNGLVSSFVAPIAIGPPIALELIKRAGRVSQVGELDRHIQFENWATHVIWRTADFQEGLAAFRGRRPPKFEGR